MFRKHNPPAGSRPGTLAIPPESPKPRISIYRYGTDGLVEREIEDVEELVPFAKVEGDDPHKLWVDIRGLGDEAVLRRVAEIFDIEPLAIEDAVNVPQRAKSEARERHQIIVARLPLLSDDGDVETPQVCLLLGRTHLLTFQERSLGAFDPVRERLRSGIGPMRELGPDYLAYALIDTVIDRYYPVAEGLSHELEDLEDEVTEGEDDESPARLHHIRHQLVVLRRIGWPQREAITSLIRDRTPFISDEVRSYLRDTQDHVAQIMELVDSCREMAVSLMDIHLSTVSTRTNEVMKVLTIVASIFIPLTFIAGVYGMNFEYMPELKSHRAYPMVIATMVLLAAGMVAFFWYRGWIGGRRTSRSADTKRR